MRDALIFAFLFALACAPLRTAIGNPDQIPEGRDLIQHYSREAVIRQALRTTWIPLWNPYEFSGFPLQADIQTGVFYPPSVALRFVPLPSFLTWTAILHIWLFGIGSYVLCRTLGAGRWASLVAAIGLMLGGVTVPRVYAGHFDVLRTVAWLPLALTCGIRSLDRQSWMPTVPSVVVLALEVLAGHVQVVCYTVLALAGYAVFTTLWPPAGRRSLAQASRSLGQVCMLIALTIGITAFQLLPTARLVLAAGRTQGMSLDNARESAVPLRQLPRTILSPDLSGEADRESMETSGYVGWLPAVLAPLAVVVSRRRRISVFLLVLALASLGLATGGPLYALHHAVLPMFRIPGRLMWLFAIAAGVLPALVLDELAAWAGRRTASASRPLVSSLPVIAAAMTTTLVAADMWRYASHFIRTERLDYRFTSSLPVMPPKYGRVLSVCENLLHTNEITALGVPSVDGYNSYFLQDYARLAERERGETPNPARSAFPRMGESAAIADRSVLNLLNVTDVIACKGETIPAMRLGAEDEYFSIYRNDQARGRVLPACGSPDAAATANGGCPDAARIEVLTADNPDGLVRANVKAPVDQLLVFSEAYYPERQAWVDGSRVPIDKVAVALSGVRVPRGDHVVELRFVPSSLWYGLMMSAIVGVVWFRLARRNARSPR